MNRRGNTRARDRALVWCAAASIASIALSSSALAQQTPPAEPPRPNQPTTTSTNLPGHPSPPQPQQTAGLDYFIGSWTFSWTGRESPITAGPRSGTVTFTRVGSSNFLSMQASGKLDGQGAYRETGTFGWNADKKVLVVQEKLANGVEMLSVGDWASPIGIRFDVQPVKVQGKTVRLRRWYAITSAMSFSVTEELSTDDGPFVRLGVGTFQKASQP